MGILRHFGLTVLLPALVGPPMAAGGTFTVTSIADSGAGTLRQAILDANANPGADQIEFAIPEGECSAAGVCTIDLATAPDPITEAVVIDGTTQPRYGTAPSNVCATETAPSYMRVEILGYPSGFYSDYTFQVESSDPSIIRGLALSRGYAIDLRSSGAHRVQCVHLGVSADGSNKVGTASGVVIDQGGNGAIVGVDGDGVDDLGERIVSAAGVGVYINGNENNVVAGNYFGLGADGVTPLSGSTCIYIRQGSSNNLVGTNEDGVSDDLERNVIGNCTTGVSLNSYAGSGDANLVVGNRFGLDVGGRMAPNATAIQLSDGGIDHEIRDNEIYWSMAGIRIEDDAAMGASSTGNCLSSNLEGVIHAGTAAATFEDNWWGAADGPSGDGPGSGDTVSVTGIGSLDFEPWLTSPPAYCAIFADGFESGDTSAWSGAVP
jgi:hypothetical protein